MEAFERRYPKPSISSQDLLLAMWWERRRVWKAALKEVQKVIIEDSNGPNTPKDLMEWLHEELEENL